jgi:RNA polymerase sigma-70 factor, ECF subfamily
MEEERTIALVIEAQAGSREAFGKLVQQFETTVFATVMSRLRHRAEAREVTQDVFVQAMRKLRQLREPARFGGWLRQIAVRMSINRAVRRPNETAFNPDTFHTLKAERRTPLDDLLRTERSREVWGGLNRLREMDRRTLIAFYVEGQSLKEMSDEFASPIGTIKRRLHTARNRLKQELTDDRPRRMQAQPA